MITNVSNPARRLEVLPHLPRFLPFLHPSYTYRPTSKVAVKSGTVPVCLTQLE